MPDSVGFGIRHIPTSVCTFLTGKLIVNCSCKPTASRPAEAWLPGGNNDVVSTTSIYRRDPSPPLIVGRSQYIGGGVGNTHIDWPEPVSGLFDDSLASEVHRPAQLKPQQKRRPSRGICTGLLQILESRDVPNSGFRLFGRMRIVL